MPVRFGTDGIRGVANLDLTPDVALALGRAVADVLPSEAVVVGRDTRRSGPMLQAAVTAGLASRGVGVVDVGVLPTPGVAFTAARRNCPAVMVSASHNPFADNGLKVFGRGGRKLADGDERALEDALGRALAGAAGAGAPASAAGHGTGAAVPVGAEVGPVATDADAADAYVEATVAALEGRDLAGMRVVLDCANGAAWQVGPAALRALGAEVSVIGDRPDGVNINAGCGSTQPEALAAAVVAGGADLGLALDGDADRLLAVDHLGGTVTGDHLLALFAADLRARGRLHGDAVVVTVMSNLGLRMALAGMGVAVHETPVGDRYVLEALDAGGLVLGGEQSGHLVFRSLATTGDGLLTAVLLADLVRRAGLPLAELAGRAMTVVPQRMTSLRVADPATVAAGAAVAAALDRARVALGEHGRVLVRPSGTEPVVRVMVEATDAALADRVLAEVCAAVEAASTGVAP